MNDKTTQPREQAAIDLDKLQRYDHQGCIMSPDASGDYFLVPDVRDFLATVAAPEAPKTGDKPAKLPWRITDAPRKIVGADGATVANLTVLDLPNAELIVASVNQTAPLVPEVAASEQQAQEPTCGMCNDSGIVGYPPDQYEECPDCIKARTATTASTCPTCKGNDSDAPCAYPSEGKLGCLRDARLAATTASASNTCPACIEDGGSCTNPDECGAIMTAFGRATAPSRNAAPLPEKVTPELAKAIEQFHKYVEPDESDLQAAWDTIRAALTQQSAAKAPSQEADVILRELVDLRKLKAGYETVPHMHHVWWMREKLADYEARWPAAWDRATAYARNAAIDAAMSAATEQGEKP